MNTAVDVGINKESHTRIFHNNHQSSRNEIDIIVKPSQMNDDNNNNNAECVQCAQTNDAVPISCLVSKTLKKYSQHTNVSAPVTANSRTRYNRGKKIDLSNQKSKSKIIFFWTSWYRIKILLSANNRRAC